VDDPPRLALSRHQVRHWRAQGYQNVNERIRRLSPGHQNMSLLRRRRERLRFRICNLTMLRMDRRASHNQKSRKSPKHQWIRGNARHRHRNAAPPQNQRIRGKSQRIVLKTKMPCKLTRQRLRLRRNRNRKTHRHKNPHRKTPLSHHHHIRRQHLRRSGTLRGRRALLLKNLKTSTKRQRQKNLPKWKLQQSPLPKDKARKQRPSSPRRQLSLPDRRPRNLNPSVAKGRKLPL
jgi:hypothetical protein